MKKATSKIMISIHALRKESDTVRQKAVRPSKISIHALRKESDDSPQGPCAGSGNFNPRSP